MTVKNETTRHSDFYMSTVTFLVEDSLFKVPRDPFQRESEVFRDMFSLPQGSSVVVEGTSDESPIRIDRTSKNDFEQLLKALLHRKYGSQPDLPHGIEQWTSVLKLSTTWNFERLRQVAIDALIESGIGAVDRVVLSQRYYIKNWLLPALNELARRPEPIALEEAKRMGVDIALKLASVRERVTVTMPAPAAYHDDFEESMYTHSVYQYSSKNNNNNNSHRVSVGNHRDPRMQDCYVARTQVTEADCSTFERMNFTFLCSHFVSVSTGLLQDHRSPMRVVLQMLKPSTNVEYHDYRRLVHPVL